AILRRNLGQKRHQLIYAPANAKELLAKENVSEENQRLFSITDHDIETLARFAVTIEEHYQKPMDIEWAKDGESGELFIVQARPETVKSQESNTVQKRFQLTQRSKIKAEGRSVG